MAWPDLANLATGGTAVEAWYDAVNARLDHLGSLLGKLDIAMKDISAGGSIGLPPADYDSGWFAVSNNAVYTKAHGLGVRPTIYLVQIDTVAGGGPADADYVVSPYDNSAQSDSTVYANATNVRLNTGTSYVLNDAENPTTASGYARARAWA